MPQSNLGGRSPVQAMAAAGTTSKNKTAAGTTQATAYAIGADHTHFSTCASGAGSIIPPVNSGDWGSVFNGGSNAMALYPPVGATLNGGSANASVSIPAGKGAIWVALDALAYLVIISA